VEDTGPSAYLPNGEGLLRFASLEGAVDAVHRVDADYTRHCRAARAIAESYFDAEVILASLLNQALP
jgi:hypothetical protein